MRADAAHPIRTHRSTVVSLGILLLTAAFHFFRGAFVDGGVYTLVALALTITATTGRGAAVGSRVVVGRWTAGVVAVVAGSLLVLAPVGSAVDVATMATLGVGVLIAAWPQPGARSSPSSSTGPTRDRRALRRTAIAWSVVGVFGCLWEVTAFFIGRYVPGQEFDYPAASDLLSPGFDHVLGRLVLVAAWLLLGFFLLRRGERR